MKICTGIKNPSPRDSMRYIDAYLNEVVDYGGEPFTRAEIIRDMQQKGIEQQYIDRWLQGQELAARLSRQRERVSVTPILSDD